MRRRLALAGLACALALGGRAPTSSAGPARAAPSSTPRGLTTLTALEDVRACLPIASGGWGAATGGGLVVVSDDGEGGDTPTTRGPHAGVPGEVRVLTALDGLPDTRVHAIASEAERGGLWVGTEGGAARILDRRVVRTVGHEAVHAVHVAASGRVFLGGWSGVLTVLDSDRDVDGRKIAPPPGAKRVTAIAEREHQIWVAFAEGPVARLDGEVLRPLPGAPRHGQALAAVGSELVLGDVEGLFALDSGAALRSLSSVDARGLAADGAGFLVATYGAGVYRKDVGRAALRAEPGLPRWARSVAVRDHRRCVATPEGLFVDEGSGFRRLPLGPAGALPSNDITAVAPDSDGRRIAIATFDRGAVVREGEGHTLHAIEGLSTDEAVNAVAWQKGDLWLATAHGLVRTDGHRVTARFRASDGLPSSIVRSLHVLGPDHLAVGTEEGPAFVETSSAPRVRPLGGLTAKKGVRPSIDSPMHATWAIAGGRDGTIYFGTSTGLYYGAFESLTAPDASRLRRASVASGELADDWVTALAIRGNQVWAGTYAGGVTRLDVADRRVVRHVHLGGGYVNPDGLTLDRDTDTLLAATMDGLLVRSVASTARDSFGWTRRSDLSTGRDVTATRRIGSTLWVASRRGLTLGGT